MKLHVRTSRTTYVRLTIGKIVRNLCAMHGPKASLL